jgi:hypothetical protein
MVLFRFFHKLLHQYVENFAKCLFGLLARFLASLERTRGIGMTLRETVSDKIKAALCGRLVFTT